MLFFKFLENKFVSALIPFDGTVDEAITVLCFTMPEGRTGQVWELNGGNVTEVADVESFASTANLLYEMS